MPKPAEIVYKGITYRSITKLCDTLGISLKLVSYRLRKGYTVEQAVETPLKRKKHEIVYKGIKYNNIKELCNYLDIPYTTVLNRVNTGYTIEQAIETHIINHNKPKKTIINGKEYLSLSEACKDLDKNYSTINGRIQLGYTAEQALSMPDKEKIIINGKEYSSIRQACIDLGKSPSTIYRNLKLGYSIEDAFEKESDRHKKFIDNPIIINNKTYSSIKKACTDLDIQYDRVCSRIRNGYTINDAFSLEDQRKCIQIDLMGKKFSSILELVNEYNIAYNTVSRRLQAGLDKEVAIINIHNIHLKYIGMDYKAYYNIGSNPEYVTARQIIEQYRPDLLDLYDKYNPKGKYNPYRGW